MRFVDPASGAEQSRRTLDGDVPEPCPQQASVSTYRIGGSILPTAIQGAVDEMLASAPG